MRRIYAGAIIGLFALVSIPAIMLLGFESLPSVGTLFPTLATWSGIVILGWCGGLFCIAMLDKWRETKGRLLSEYGLLSGEQQAALWVYVNTPLLIGLSLFVLTLVDAASSGRALLAQKAVVLSVGFIPLWAYGLYRAAEITREALGQRPTEPTMVQPRYMSTKWRYGIVLFANVIATPFFGSAAIAGDLWRHVPRSRRIGVPIMVAISVLATLSLKPVLAQLRQGGAEVLLFYVTFAIFAAVMQILVWKVFTGPRPRESGS